MVALKKTLQVMQNQKSNLLIIKTMEPYTLTFNPFHNHTLFTAPVLSHFPLVE